MNCYFKSNMAMKTDTDFDTCGSELLRSIVSKYHNRDGLSGCITIVNIIIPGSSLSHKAVKDP